MARVSARSTTWEPSATSSTAAPRASPPSAECEFRRRDVFWTDVMYHISGVRRTSVSMMENWPLEPKRSSVSARWAATQFNQGQIFRYPGMAATVTDSPAGERPNSVALSALHTKRDNYLGQDLRFANNGSEHCKCGRHYTGENCDTVKSCENGAELVDGR